MEETLTEEQISSFREELLARVPGEGSKGNVSLIKELGWPEDRYWLIRNKLIDDGRLEKGRGKGGSVKRVHLEASIASSPSESSVDAIPAAAARESDLYQPMSSVLQTRWVLDSRLDQSVIEITAAAGSKNTGGKWSRPDITIGAYRTFSYVPGKFFDVVVFEIKPHWAIDVTVVFEALAHRRAAHRAYALLHVPPERTEELESALEEIASEAKKYGIGVITAAVPDNYDTWDEIVEAIRHDPDPERLNEFLAQQVTQGFRDKIMKWFR